MRVVLDTNVLVSGIYFGGAPGRVLSAWSEGRFELLASVEVLAEYRAVVARLRERYPSVDPSPALDLVLHHCRIVEPVPVPQEACTDADDLKFLACAVAGRATCVVSGDKAVRRASGQGGVPVLSPREFADRFL